MYIIGDIGNTEVKVFFYSKENKFKKKLILKSNLISNKYLNKKLSFIFVDKIQVEKIIFCSVVPKIFNLIKNYLRKKTKIKCYELKQINLKKLINIKVNKKQIGSDRLSNAISVLDNNNNYIIVDFGTATTFDVVIKKNYLGGIIAPGVTLSLNTLSSKASLIPPIKLKSVDKILGNNTVSAVRSGFYWGYIGLIENIINLIKKETRKPFKIIITGGFSHLFATSIYKKAVINKDITINGLIKATDLIK